MNNSVTEISHPTLYSFRRCPYAMRARMALVINNVKVHLREVILKDKPTSLISYSPKGTVPVLITANNQVIEESREIMDWALAQTSSAKFSAPCDAQQDLINTNDGEFKRYLDKYKYADRHPQHPQDYYRQQGEKFLAQLEQYLSHQPFLFGHEMSYADIAIFPFVRQFAGVENGWFEQSNFLQLQQWLNYFLTSQQFKAAMKKYPQWHENDPIVTFPTDTAS